VIKQGLKLIKGFDYSPSGEYFCTKFSFNTSFKCKFEETGVKNLLKVFDFGHERRNYCIVSHFDSSQKYNKDWSIVGWGFLLFKNTSIL